MREVKVRILSTCPNCNGSAYFPYREARDYQGKPYMQYLPCTMCHGSGVTAKWVSLPELHKLLEQSLCPHEHVSTLGGHHFTIGNVWDDIEEVCDDCGQTLD